MYTCLQTAVRSLPRSGCILPRGAGSGSIPNAFAKSSMMGCIIAICSAVAGSCFAPTPRYLFSTFPADKDLPAVDAAPDTALGDWHLAVHAKDDEEAPCHVLAEECTG